MQKGGDQQVQVIISIMQQRPADVQAVALIGWGHPPEKVALRRRQETI
jgi:hypothetical protein